MEGGKDGTDPHPQNLKVTSNNNNDNDKKQSSEYPHSLKQNQKSAEQWLVAGSFTTLDPLHINDKSYW